MGILVQLYRCPPRKVLAEGHVFALDVACGQRAKAGCRSIAKKVGGSLTQPSSDVNVNWAWQECCSNSSKEGSQQVQNGNSIQPCRDQASPARPLQASGSMGCDSTGDLQCNIQGGLTAAALQI